MKHSFAPYGKAAKIDAFFRRWLARLPHTFTGADRCAGYRYQLSVLQAEFSLTQVLDRPHPVAVAHPRAHPGGHPNRSTSTTSTPRSSSATNSNERINDTRDFGIGKRLGNLPELRQVGFHANRRLLATQRLGHDPITAARALAQITDPVTLADSQTRVAGLRFGDPRAMALLSLLAVVRLSVRGFTNRDLDLVFTPARVKDLATR